MIAGVGQAPGRTDIEGMRENMTFASKNLTKVAVVASIACALALMLTISSAPAKADTLDPLHGYCSGGQCIDNGTNSPTTQNPPTGFGFTVSPGPALGTVLRFEVLEPNNVAQTAPVGFTGTFTGSASLFSGTAWTSGQLDSYLGISASPTNPIGAFLPSTQGLDAGATGFFVYQFTASIPGGLILLQDPSNPNVSPLESLTSGVPLGSYIVGFFNEGTTDVPNWIATANSGAIFIDGRPTSMTPEPGTLLLFGTGMIGLAGLIRKRFSN